MLEKRRRSISGVETGKVVRRKKGWRPRTVRRRSSFKPDFLEQRKSHEMEVRKRCN